ncbi:s-phase kinase-associated protein 1 [Hypoxylon argillaceum]|nr:s-phase kinase-associated protein 1 [Hypoxylon argillaceum]
MSFGPLITLISRDGIAIQATRNAVIQSVVFETMLELLDDEHTIGMPIPVLEVDGEILKKVMEWCEYHRGDGRMASVEEAPGLDGAQYSEWDQRFLSMDRNQLIEVINAANYLDIPLLLKYGICTVASNLAELTTEQMRQFLNIQNDLTPEQEQELRADNAWAQRD